MYLFRAMSEDEYKLFMAGKVISSDKDFSIYYRDTTSFGICFFKVDGTDDEEVLVRDRYDDYDKYVDISIILQLTGNYDSYKYGVYFEIPDDKKYVVRRHGTYQGDRFLYTAQEMCTHKYHKSIYKVKKVVTL